MVPRQDEVCSRQVLVGYASKAEVNPTEFHEPELSGPKKRSGNGPTKRR